jgi:hypothetical protein
MTFISRQTTRQEEESGVPERTMYETPDVILAADAGHGYGNKQRGKHEVIAPLPPATEDIDCRYPAERTEKVSNRCGNRRVGHKQCEMAKNGKPIKRATPEKANVFRGAAGEFASLRKPLVPEVGLEPTHDFTHTGF